jgi:hypothetical protein
MGAALEVFRNQVGKYRIPKRYKAIVAEGY